MQFAYTAKSMQGEAARGILTADTLAQAQQLLRQQGLFPISVAAAGRVAAQPRRRGRRVSRKELMAFTSQLAIMTKAGIDVAGAVQSLARQSENPVLRTTLENVHADILAGKPFSVSLKNQSHVFGEAYVASVSAGEASGRLADVLSRLAAMQRAEVRAVAGRRAMLAYPLVLSVVAGAVVLGLLFFVLPQFADIFDQFEMTLPVITQVLLAIAGELRARWWLWIGLAGLATTGLTVWRRSPSGQRLCDQWLLNGPMVGGVTRATITGRAFRLLGLMLESGVPLVEALRLTRASLPNRLFRELFDLLEKEVLNGRPLAESLATASFVPSGATEMIATAERTGTLDTVTQIIGEHYEEEGESRLRELATMVEPAIIVVMGVVVACIVLAVMLPMFDFATLGQH